MTTIPAPVHVLTQEQREDEFNIVPADSRGISAPTGVVRCYHKHMILLEQCGDKTCIVLEHGWTVNTIAGLRPKSPSAEENLQIYSLVTFDLYQNPACSKSNVIFVTFDVKCGCITFATIEEDGDEDFKTGPSF